MGVAVEVEAGEIRDRLGRAASYRLPTSKEMP
jgi:hypothetical protein